MIALTRYPSASWASDNVELSNIARLGFTIRRQARQTARPNRVHNSYGLVVLLQLLPTPPHDDAVTFRYRPESVYLKRTHTSLIKQTCKRTVLCLRHPSTNRRATLPINFVIYYQNFARLAFRRCADAQRGIQCSAPGLGRPYCQTGFRETSPPESP